MKKIIVGFVLLLFIIAGVFVFSVVRSFDADSYKNKIVSTLEELTGRKVQCAQDVSLSWRPRPTFVMNDLIISNQDGSSTPNMISVKQIQVEMDWTSFFNSDLKIKKVILSDPNILVERLHTYQTNFTFPVLFNPVQMGGQDGILSGSNDVQIDVLEINNATITYHNALNGQTFVLKGINGSGQVESLEGPFSFKGTVGFSQNNLDVELKTQKINVSQPLSGSLVLSDSSSLMRSDISYTLSMNTKAEWLRLSGDFSCEKPTDFFKRFLLLNWPELGDLKGNFTYVVNPQQSLLKELVLVQENNENPISLNWLFDKDKETQKDKGTLSVNLLNFDLWGELIQKIPYKKLKQAQSPLQVSLSVAQLVFREQNISDVLIQGDISDGVLNATVGAKLPHNGLLSAKGKYNFDSFDGELIFKTEDLQSLLNWFYVQKPTWMPDGQMGVAQMTANMVLSEKEQKLDIQSLSVDGVQLTGKIEKNTDTLKANLTVQDLNWDVYYPSVKDLNDAAVITWLKEKVLKNTQWGKNLYLDLNLTNTTVKEKVFDEVLINAKLVDKTWDVGQLNIKKKEDIDLGLSGKIIPKENDFSFENLRLDFNFYDLNAWSQLIPEFAQKTLGNVTSGSGFMIYTGDFEKGLFETQSTLDKMQITAKGQVNWKQKDFENVQLKLTDPSLLEVMNTFYPNNKLSGKWDIPFEFSGIVFGNLNQKSWKDASLTLAKDIFQMSGSWQPQNIQIDVHSDNVNLDLFLPKAETILSVSPQPFEMNTQIPNGRLNLSADKFVYGDIQGSQLKLKASVLDKNITLTSFDCLIGDKQPGRISADGSIVFENQVQPDLHIELDKIQVGLNDLSFASYRFAEGFVSGDIRFKASGDSWATLVNSAKGEGNMNWTNGVFYGMDTSAWLSAVQSALMAEQMGNSFSSRLQFALSNGRTVLPELSGKFVLENGFMNFMDIRGKNETISIAGAQMEISAAKEGTHIKMPIILTALSKLPPVVFDFNHNSHSIQRTPFEQAFDEELRLKNKQSLEAKQLQSFREKELRNKQMRQEAQNIMKQTEQTLRQLQERVELRGDSVSGDRLDKLNFTAREIRELAVKTDLNPTEYAALLEKAKLWAIQVNELNNSYARQDLLSQKAQTSQLSPLVSNYLANMEQFYQQHPQSVILAEIVMNARQVADSIKTDERQLATAQDTKTAQSLIIRIQDNFSKIEKAHQYAQKLHLSLMNGGTKL